MGTTEFALKQRPLNNGDFCGDIGVFKEFGDKLFIGIVDVLGHGKDADTLALELKNFLQENDELDLEKLMGDLHSHFKGSRGAAVGVCLVNLATGHVDCVCTGNVTIRKIGKSSARVISSEGIVGYMMRPAALKCLKLENGDVLLCYTDGVTDRFNREDCPELLTDDARTIAETIIDRFAKQHDDALCMALTYNRRPGDG